MTDVEFAHLLDTSYGARVTRVDAVHEGDGRSLYAVHRGRGRPWVARVFPSDRAAERVLGDAAILTYLELWGFPAERVVRVADGSLVSRLGERSVLVTGHVPGAPPSRGPEDLEALGELAGRLRRLPEPPPASCLLARRAGSLPREDLDYALARLASVQDRVPAARTGELHSLQAALAATHDCRNLPFGIVHPDCQPGNVLRRPDGRLVLVDWDGAGQGPHLVTLGVMLFAGTVATPGQPAGGGDLSRVDHLMRGYQRHAGLTHAEVDGLADAIRFRPLVVAARESAASIERGEPATPAGWWTRYDLAEAIADRVRETHRPPKRRSTAIG